MASYVPNVRKPLENLQQEMDYSRGRALNPNLDIVLPTYIIDSTVVRSITQDSFDYVENYLKKCPTNCTRFVYEENYTSQKPMHKVISIGSLLYYAFRKRSLASIGVLMQHGARALQPSYLMQWGSLQGGEPAIEIVEKPNVAWLAELFFDGDLEFPAKVFKQLKLVNVDLGTPVELRAQKLQQPHPNSIKTTQFVDAWECLEKELEKTCPPAKLPNAKINMKKIHTLYNTDKLETIYEKPKKKVKKEENVKKEEE